MRREKFNKYMLIAERAEKEGLFKGERVTLLMDIESADRTFELRLDEWLNADKLDFEHDLLGITNNIVRDDFPATDFGFFVPRFAGTTTTV